jgi:sulfite exporter TauE/SafE
MVTSTLLATIFLASLLSGWHCALMCGGIAASVERSTEHRLRQMKQKSLFVEQLWMHGGRLLTYVILGSVTGALGYLVWQQDILPMQRYLFALAALIFILQGVRILRQERGRLSKLEHWLNQKAAAIWSHLAAVNVSGAYRGRFVRGMVWGLVPCGLIYSVLPLAFLSGDALSGAAFMLAFGLGTLPNLLLISGLSARLAAWAHQSWARYVVGILMIITGSIGLYRAWTLPFDLIRGGFCIS